MKQLKADQRLALTGTPLENRLLDLWSIHRLRPTRLPRHAGPISLHTYEPKAAGEDAAWTRRSIARRRLSAPSCVPLLLRRLKRQVAQGFARSHRGSGATANWAISPAQVVSRGTAAQPRANPCRPSSEQGLARSKIHVLAALTRLRQVCCHPELVGSDSPSAARPKRCSNCWNRCIAGRARRFWSFQSICADAPAHREGMSGPRNFPTQCAHRRIEGTGKTIVQSFPETTRMRAVFLLSLRAAGTGLNLTTASYVVLYDPWWNPAVEAQAIDRSHRIGQTRTVNAYRLIAPGTVEEKIWELQQRKAQTISRCARRGRLRQEPLANGSRIPFLRGVSTGLSSSTHRHHDSETW